MNKQKIGFAMMEGLIAMAIIAILLAIILRAVIDVRAKKAGSGSPQTTNVVETGVKN